MAQSLQIPTLVAPGVAERARELRLEQELEAMLEHTRQAIPDLKQIDVTLYDDREMEPDGALILITAWRNSPADVEDSSREEWNQWQLEAFSPDVFRWIEFDAPSWELHGR